MYREAAGGRSEWGLVQVVGRGEGRGRDAVMPCVLLCSVLMRTAQPPILLFIEYLLPGTVGGAVCETMKIPNNLFTLPF